MYRHILVPTDGSDLSMKAVVEGVKLAGALGSHLTFLTVEIPFASLGDYGHAFAGLPEEVRSQALTYLRSEARAALERATSTAKSAAVASDTKIVESDHPYQAILATAKLIGADLILMASHGRSGVNALLLGSVTQKILAHTDLPVLVCR